MITQRNFTLQEELEALISRDDFLESELISKIKEIDNSEISFFKRLLVDAARYNRLLIVMHLIEQLT